MKQFKLIAGLVLFACLTVSCASNPVVRTYTGPELAEKELGFVRVIYQIDIVKVDDLYVGEGKPKHREYNPLASGNPFGYKGIRIIEFLPGSHELAIEFITSTSYTYGSGYTHTKTLSSTRPQTIRFTVEAGHLYDVSINPDWVNRTCHPKVEDVTNAKWVKRGFLPSIRKHKSKMK